MTNKLKIWNLIFFFSFCFTCFAQIPLKKPDLYSYQDNQNARYIGKNYSKLWIVRGALSNDIWNEGTEYYEFDKVGRVVFKVSDKFKNGEFRPDTAIFTYAENGIWETKFELGQITLRDFEYDEHERLIKISTSNGKITTYEYLENDRVSKISYSEANWDEFEYFEDGQLKSTQSYKNAILSQIDNYEYEESVIHKIQMNFYDFLPNDTVFEYESRYYNQDTLTIKIINKSEDSFGWITNITSARYNQNNLMTLTYCLTNESPCSYVDFNYNEAGNFIGSSAHAGIGALKTRSTVLKFEFW